MANEQEQTVAGAPEGVTFSSGNNSFTSSAPQSSDQPASPPQDAQQDDSAQPPAGVSFDDANTKHLAPPSGVTFDDQKTLPLNPGARTGSRIVGPSGVVRDDFGTNQHEEFLSQPTGGTSIGPQEHGFHQWLQNVQNDVRDGSDTTWFGAMLKKMGNTGTRTGVSEGTAGAMEAANPLASIPLGLSKIGEGGIEFLRQTPAVMKHVAQGDDLRTAIIKASVDDPQLLKKAEIGANKIVGGAFQAAGPLALASPAGALEAVPTITGAMVAQHVATKTAKAMGADDDTAELVGNVAAIASGHALNEKINPLTKRFGAAVNDRTAAEAEYTNRVRNLETARGQAVQAQSDALDTAQKEAAGKAKPEDTVAARQRANDATANVTDAQKAVDTATKNRADSIVQLEKLHRGIKEEADKANEKFDDQFKGDATKAKDYFQKAVPSKGAHRYDGEDYDIWRGYMERAKRSGAKVNNFEDAYNVTEAQRQSIEDSLDPAVEKLKDNPLTTNPYTDVMSNLEELAKFEPGIKDAAADELAKYNLKDLTVEEGRRAIKQLNDKNRAEMKNKSNWDVSQMMTNDPAFAARYLAVKSLREGFYGALKKAGVEGAEQARGEEASLIQVRDAIGAQLRANRGGVTVRGSGEQSKIRSAVANLTGKIIHGAAIAKGAVMGGPEGAIIGSAVGEHIAEPVEDYIAPRDITRDEHVRKSMELRGTLRQPTKIRGVEGAQPSRPNFELPPDVKDQMPASVPKVPRENTELHAELAAHYLEPLGDSTYQELEDRLKKDIAVKNVNDPTTVTPAEKTLFTKVLKLDAADAAANKKALEEVSATSSAAAQAPITKEDKTNLRDEQIAAAARANNGVAPSTIDINPHLRSLGRADESALVSHSPAMKAHAPAAEIEGLPEGVTSEDAHREEWAHTAIGAVDGLSPIEIRSDLHPKSEKGAAATSVFDATQIKDENGAYDPEALETQLTQWLTQKMAGPASHEVFRGVPKEELKNGASNRSDFREARALVREVHPDFTPKQVEELVDAAYDRAHDFLSKPHIADRVRANASVREEGLPETYHASHGRVNQFAEDIRKAHNENEGNDAGPDGSGAGEGGEKSEKKPDAGTERAGEPAGKEDGGKKKNGGRDKNGSKGESREGAEESSATSGKPEDRVGYRPSEKAETLSGARKDYGPEFDAAQHQHEIDRYKSIVRNPKATEEEKTVAKQRLFEMQNPDLFEVNSKTLRKSQVPPEHSTGDEARDKAIKAGGGIPGGAMGDISMFHSPSTGSTLALKHADITPERVKAHIATSDALFKPEQKVAEENSQTRTAPSAGTGIDHDEVYKSIARAYGVHDDPKIERTAGFITPDARYIDLPIDHTQAIEENGGAAGGAKDNRKDFINDTGAIRVHKARERAGNVLAFSVPKDGVTPEQADAMARSFGKNGDRNGVLRIERADISPETRNKLSTEQEFPSASNVKPMLEKIGALQEENSATNKKENDVAKGADEFNKESGREAIVPGITHSPEVAKKIADAYDAMKHDPENPAVKASYQAFKNDIDKQWDYATNKMGMTFEPWKQEGQPYANSKEMVNDVRNNKHLSFYQGGDIPAGHPTAEIDPKTGFSYNDKFRAIHDLFGHAAQENQFGPKGEENAWNEHRQMFSPEAIPAMTADTRGQNSWVNFGKHLRDSEGNVPTKGQEGHVPVTERPYAEQKAGLLPEEFNKPNGVEENSQTNRGPKGSSVPLMKQPLDVEGTGEKGKVSTLDVAKALNEFSQDKNPALAHDEAEPKAMTDRAKKIAEDEAKYQLAQGRTGKEWYTEEMKDHDKALIGMRPDLTQGPDIDAVPGHTAKLTLFKAAEAVLSSGQKPYGNFKSAVNAWDAYQKTGEFPRMNPATGKSWGPRGEATYGNALDMINQLVKEKGEKGAADWLLSEHPVSELKQYNPEGVAGKKTDMVPGAMILGAKRGPFMQNLHGIESAFTADMWVARSWNRWMGTIETGKNKDGVEEITSDSPRNGAERDMMKQSFEHVANKLNLTTSSLQAVLWYYEQGLYRAHGVPKESWSFSDAAKRAASEEKAPAQKGMFDDQTKAGGLSSLAGTVKPKKAGAIHAFDFLNALKK